MTSHLRSRKETWLRAVAAITGIVLTAIGVRFLVAPITAATFFGIDRHNPANALHHAIALRDLWLGLALLAFAYLRDWRALTLLLGLGTLVCFGDAAIALSSSGRWVSVTFHAAAGVLCAFLTHQFWLQFTCQAHNRKPAS